MSSATRNARRIQQRKGPSAIHQQVTQAATRLETTMESLQVLPEMITRLQEQTDRAEEQTKRAEALAAALADDYQTLLTELEIQRAVTIKLITRTSTGVEDWWKKLEAHLREEVLRERKAAKDG